MREENPGARDTRTEGYERDAFLAKESEQVNGRVLRYQCWAFPDAKWGCT